MYVGKVYTPETEPQFLYFKNYYYRMGLDRIVPWLPLRVDINMTEAEVMIARGKGTDGMVETRENPGLPKRGSGGAAQQWKNIRGPLLQALFKVRLQNYI